MNMHPFPHRKSRQRGFTMIELVMIIVILGILSAVAYERWPVGMEEAAAAKEFKRAVRYAQHKAMTRQYDETTPTTAWGITVNGNRYTIRRQDANCVPPAADATDRDRCAEEEYLNRALNDNNSSTLTDGAVWFNALGEPINPADGTPVVPVPPAVAAVSFTVAGTITVTVSPQTGYVQ